MSILRDALDEAAEYAPDGEAAPQIVAALIIAGGLETVARAIDNLHDVLRSDHPLQGSTLEGIEQSLGAIASGLGEVAEATKSLK